MSWHTRLMFHPETPSASAVGISAGSAQASLPAWVHFRPGDWVSTPQGRVGQVLRMHGLLPNAQLAWATVQFPAQTAQGVSTPTGYTEDFEQSVLSLADRAVADPEAEALVQRALRLAEAVRKAGGRIEEPPAIRHPGRFEEEEEGVTELEEELEEE